MNTIPLILSIASVILSSYSLSVSLSNKARLDALETAQTGPDVGAMGAGGSGRR